MITIGVKCNKCGRFYHEKKDIEVDDIVDDMSDLLSKAEKSGWEVSWVDTECICLECVKEQKENELPDEILWTTYLNGSKEQNFDMVSEIEEKFNIKLPQEAVDKLIYCLYELELRLSINPKTGDYKILSYKE